MMMICVDNSKWTKFKVGESYLVTEKTSCYEIRSRDGQILMAFPYFITQPYGSRIVKLNGQDLINLYFISVEESRDKILTKLGI